MPLDCRSKVHLLVGCVDFQGLLGVGGSCPRVQSAQSPRSDNPGNTVSACPFSACPARCAVAHRRPGGRLLDSNAELPQERLIAVCQRQPGPIRLRDRRFGVRGPLMEIGPARRFQKGCVYRQRNGVSGLLDVIEDVRHRTGVGQSPMDRIPQLLHKAF